MSDIFCGSGSSISKKSGFELSANPGGFKGIAGIAQAMVTHSKPKDKTEQAVESK